MLKEKGLYEMFVKMAKEVLRYSLTVFLPYSSHTVHTVDWTEENRVITSHLSLSNPRGTAHIW